MGEVRTHAQANKMVLELGGMENDYTPLVAQVHDRKTIQL
jgi:hypothetical protein